MAPGGMATDAPGDYSVVVCTACHMKVYGMAARARHYKSELHRVNLQRRVANAGAPLSPEEFARRVEAARQQAEASAPTGKRRQSAYCEVCAKKFSSEKAFANHCRSRRHLDAARRRPMSDVTSVATVEAGAQDTTDVELASASGSEEECAPIPAHVCVFDGHVSEDFEANLRYMASNFGFFLPYIEYLADLEALLAYLGTKVGVGNCCVECDRSFNTLDAVRRHMTDKQHCRMTEHDEVWAEEYAEFYDFGDDDDDEGWEEVDDVLDEEEAQPMDQLIVADKQLTVPRTPHEPLLPSAADNSAATQEVALVVNGKALGHRSLQRYYKQNFTRMDRRDAAMIARMSREYRVLGYQGLRQRVPKSVREAARAEAASRRKHELQVGAKNYYTRKSGLKPKMAVFNSGYRP